MNIHLPPSNMEHQAHTASLAEPDQLAQRLQRARATIQSGAEGRLAEMLNYIRKIDRQLEWTDRLLYHSQPPATGRIRVVGVKDDPQSDLYRPCLVSWTLVSKKAGKELWRYRVLTKPTKAVRGKGGFATYRRETVRLVEIASDLIRQRSSITKQLADLGRSWTQKERILSEKEIDTVDDLLAIIDSMNAKGTLNLDPDRIMN